MAVAGRRQATARAVTGLLVATALPLAAALVVRPLAGGNAGWEVAGGAALAALIVGLALASRGGGGRSAPGETGLALAVWLGAAGALIVPALVAA